METERPEQLAKYQRLLKEKFVKVGLGEFFDREILELIFSYSRPRKKNTRLAESLLAYYGSFKNIIDTSLTELVAYPGLDGHSAILLNLVKEGAEFYLENKCIKQNAFKCWDDIVSYCRISMEGLKEEHFKAIFLDSNNKVLSIETIHEGTIDRAIIYPRAIIRKALLNNARNLILVHNHPSGNPTPSVDDTRMTEELINATRSIDIEIIDHLIIGDNKIFSFRDSGLLFKIQ